MSPTNIITTNHGVFQEFLVFTVNDGKPVIASECNERSNLVLFTYSDEIASPSARNDSSLRKTTF